MSEEDVKDAINVLYRGKIHEWDLEAEPLDGVAGALVSVSSFLPMVKRILFGCLSLLDCSKTPPSPRRRSFGSLSSSKPLPQARQLALLFDVQISIVHSQPIKGQLQQ